MSESWRTITVAAPRLAGWVARFAKRHGPPQARVVATTVTLTSPDQAEARLWLRWEDTLDSADPVSSLVAAALRPRRLGLLLVRRERHALGIWDQGLVCSRTGRHHVQGRTKAGGWSQQRYARRREQQARQAFADAATDAAVILEPEVTGLEAVLLAGDSAGLDAVLADRRCTALADLVRSRATARLEIREPNRDALVDLVTRYNAALVELNQYA